MKTLLIDSNYLLHRSLRGGSGHLKTSAGLTTGGIFGFINSLRNAMNLFEVTDVIAIWDSAHSKRRIELLPEYKNKGGDKTPEDLDYFQKFNQSRKYLHPLLESLGVRSYSIPGYEADDVLYKMSRFENREWVIMSDDNDLTQCVNTNVIVYRPINDARNGKGIVNIFNFEEITSTKSPAHFCLVKAIEGDGSDNIPGVYRVGWTSALKIINLITEPTLVEMKRVCFENQSKSIFKAVLDNFNIVERNLKLVDLAFEEIDNIHCMEMELLLNTRIPFNELNVRSLLSQLEFNSYLSKFTDWVYPFKRICK
jgi:5'-3' exonuclease